MKIFRNLATGLAAAIVGWAGLQRSIEKGWLVLHESGTFVMFTPAGADLFA
jgi:hypothetical protein